MTASAAATAASSDLAVDDGAQEDDAGGNGQVLVRGHVGTLAFVVGVVGNAVAVFAVLAVDAALADAVLADALALHWFADELFSWSSLFSRRRSWSSFHVPLNRLAAGHHLSCLVALHRIVLAKAAAFNNQSWGGVGFRQLLRETLLLTSASL